MTEHTPGPMNKSTKLTKDEKSAVMFLLHNKDDVDYRKYRDARSTVKKAIRRIEKELGILMRRDDAT